MYRLQPLGPVGKVVLLWHQGDLQGCSLCLPAPLCTKLKTNVTSTTTAAHKDTASTSVLLLEEISLPWKYTAPGQIRTDIPLK